MESGVYCIRNKINEKVYVGSTRNFGCRWNEHKYRLRKGCHANTHLQNSWNKHKESSFEFCILDRCPCDIMLDSESIWIKTKESSDRTKGYNYETDPVNRTKTKEHKQKISDTLKRKYKNGYVNPNKGKTCSEEVRKKMSVSQKGRKLSEERRRKISESHIVRPVTQFTKEGELMNSFKSIKEASQFLGIPSPNITMCCKGNRKSAGGFTFKYKEVS